MASPLGRASSLAALSPSSPLGPVARTSSRLEVKDIALSSSPRDQANNLASPTNGGSAGGEKPKLGSKKLQSLFGAGFDATTIKKDQNTAARSAVLKAGYRVPDWADDEKAATNGTSVSSIDEKDLWTLYRDHRDMPDVFKARYDEADDTQLPITPLTIPNTFQLVFDLKSTVITIGESIEAYVSLYSSVKRKFVYEEFALRFNDRGAPVSTPCKACFIDLIGDDVQLGLKLVVRLYRSGALVNDKAKKAKELTIRRPWGAAVIDLPQTMIQKLFTESREIVPPAVKLFVTASEREFTSAYELVTAASNEATLSKSTFTISYGLRGFAGRMPPPANASATPPSVIGSSSSALALSRSSSNNLASPSSPRAGASGLVSSLAPSSTSWAATQQDWLPPELNDIPWIPKTGIMPLRAGESKNTLYVTIGGGEFLQGRKKTAKNVMVRVILRNNADCTPIEKCFTRGRGPMSQTGNDFCSYVYYHNNSPQWGERIAVRLPAQGVLEKCHLFFEIAHTSSSSTKKDAETFSFAFLPLTEEKKNTIISDRQYTLPVYKFSTRTPKTNEGYLQYDKKTQEARNTKEKFTIHTHLSSTLLSQDNDIHKILNWDRTPPNELVDALKAIPSKPVRLLTNYLERLCDCMFDMLSQSDYQLSEAKFATICRGPAKDASPSSLVAPKILSVLAHILQMGATSQTSGNGTSSSSSSSGLPPTPTNGAVSPSPTSETKFTFNEDDQGGDVLGLASSQGGDNTGGVLSHYIDKVFSGAHAHSLLISYLRALLQWCVTDEAKGLKGAAGGITSSTLAAIRHRSMLERERKNHDRMNDFVEGERDIDNEDGRYRDLMNCLIGLPFLIQFSLKAYNLDRRSGLPSTTPVKFRTLLTGIISDITACMPVMSPPWLANVQRYAIDHFHTITNIISSSGMISRIRILAMTIEFIDRSTCSLRNLDQIENEDLCTRKLRFVHKLITSEHILARASSVGWRLPLLGAAQRTVNRHLNRARSMNERAHSTSLLLSLIPHILNGEDELNNTRASLAPTLERKESKETKISTATATTTAATATTEPELTDEDKEEEKKYRTAEDGGDRDIRLLTSLLALPLTDWLKELLTARDTNVFSSTIVRHLFNDVNEDALIPDAAAAFLILQLVEPPRDDDKKDAPKLAAAGTAAAAKTGAAIVPAKRPLPKLRSLMAPSTWDALLATFKGRGVGRELEASFLATLFETALSVVANSAFNKYWVIMRQKELRWCQQLVEWCGARLCQFFMASTSFDARLWTLYCVLGCKLLLCEDMNIDAQSEYKKAFMERRYKDNRTSIVTMLGASWSFLGPKQYEFISALVGPLIELSQSKLKVVAEMAQTMYFNLMVREFDHDSSYSFQHVQYHTIDAVGRIVHAYGSKDRAVLNDYTQFFNTTLRATLDLPVNARLEQAGAVFLRDIEELFQHLALFESLPAKKRWEDERTSACINLVHYLRQSGKMDMHRQYLTYLVDLHQELGNCVEIGLTLLMHSQSLSWSHHMLDAFAPWPAQTETQRKIELSLMAVKNFDLAKHWEMSIKVQQELADAYERKLYDIPALTKSLRQQATYFDQILTEDRIFPSYYRVALYGSGFPADVRGQEWIYRSGDGVNPEGVRDFTNRIKEKYPDAKIVNSTDLPPANVLDASAGNDTKDDNTNDSNGTAATTAAGDASSSSSGNGEAKGLQYVQICTLACSSDEELDQLPSRWSNVDPPPRLMKYHTNTNVRVFSFARISKEHQPPKAEKGVKVNEYRDLWTVRTFLVAAEPLPSLQRRMRVVERREQVLCPIENAVSTIVSKNAELKEIIYNIKTSTDPQVSISPLSMQLAGVIDAAVQGGVEKYREAFFDGTYLMVNPQHAPFIQQFKLALGTQLEVLKEGLDVFGSKMDKSLIPLHTHLSKTYSVMCDGLAEMASTASSSSSASSSKPSL